METIELNRTIKSRIFFQNSEDISKIVASQEAFVQGCNFVSEYMFNNNFPMNTTTLVKLLEPDEFFVLDKKSDYTEMIKSRLPQEEPDNDDDLDLPF